MPEASYLAAFHILRPWWLLGLAPTILFYVVIRHRGSVERQWKGIIDPHLLASLKTGTTRGLRFRPIHLISLVAE